MRSKNLPDVPSHCRAGIEHQGWAVDTEVAVCTEGHHQGPGGVIHSITLRNIQGLSRLLDEGMSLITGVF